MWTEDITQSKQYACCCVSKSDTKKDLRSWEETTSLARLLKITDFSTNAPENMKMQMYGKCWQIFSIIYLWLQLWKVPSSVLTEGFLLTLPLLMISEN